MTFDVHVWGDSHWRNFFPVVNHGPPGFTHEQDGVRVIDMVANELSGATMYGLLNPNSKNGARRRILGDLDRLGGVDHAALVFGEVDCRYPQHHDRYFREDHSLDISEVMRLVARYRNFIDNDLLTTNLVRKKVFVYFGFSYPNGADTLLQPGQPMGNRALDRSRTMHHYLRHFLGGGDVNLLNYPHDHNSKVRTIIGYDNWVKDMVSPDGVHLLPERIFPEIVLPALKHGLGLSRPLVVGVLPL